MCKWNIRYKNGEEKYTLIDGGYAFSPAGLGISFKNVGNDTAKFLLYKQIYIQLKALKQKFVLEMLMILNVKFMVKWKMYI